MSNHRLHAIMLALLFALVLVYAAVAQDGPATILIETDGEVATVEVSGSDAYYPGPSQVTFEHDALGVVVVTRTRLLAVMDERVYLSGVWR